MKKMLLLVLLLAALPAAAQRPAVANQRLTLTCAEVKPSSTLQKVYCEIREITLPGPPAGTALTVDARANGGITVRGWSGPTVLLRARVIGRAATPEMAKALALAVHVATQNHTVRASRANESLDGWAVDYELLVPDRTDLTLKAQNGSLALANVAGRLRLETVNGSLSLADVNGDVRGQTINGSVAIALAGPAWVGPGLEATTVNGSVTWQLPPVYAATILARTTHGKVTAELNTRRKSVLPHNLAATLGKGGAQLKASTVNGSVLVQQPPEAAPAVVPTDSTDVE